MCGFTGNRNLASLVGSKLSRAFRAPCILALIHEGQLPTTPILTVHQLFLTTYQRLQNHLNQRPSDLCTIFTMRKSDKNKTARYVRSRDRFFRQSDQWFFQTREGARGPFAHREIAEQELSRFIALREHYTTPFFPRNVNFTRSSSGSFSD